MRVVIINLQLKLPVKGQSILMLTDTSSRIKIDTENILQFDVLSAGS